jgi:SepF-like predicted cell division protein (DUF552 family)
MLSMRGAAVTAFLVVVAAFVGGCGGEEQSTGSSEEEVAEQRVAEPETEFTEETTTPAKTTDSSPEQGVASVGELVTLGDVQWIVTNPKQSEELLSIKGEYEEGNFVIADVGFSNNTNQDITLATPFMTLIDSQGNEFEADIEYNFTFLYPEENMFVDPIEPGASKEGKIIFSVAPDSSDFRLQVGEGRFASDETGYIDLGF